MSNFTLLGAGLSTCVADKGRGGNLKDFVGTGEAIPLGP